MQSVNLKDLLEAGCHFGHKSERWHPKAAQFIYQAREGIHIIDLAKTKERLEQAAEFIQSLGKDGKNLLFVGTKRQASSIIKSEAERVEAPYFCQRWIGGFLTNWETVHQNLEKIRRLEEEQTSGAWDVFPKHERLKLRRYLNRLKFFYGGVSSLDQIPDALFVVDIRREKVAVSEARKKGIPIIGIVDTNSDPTQVDYSIPANDDAISSVEFIVKYIAEAYREGKEMGQKLQKTADSKQPVAKEQKASNPEISEPAIKGVQTKKKGRGRPRKAQA